MRPEDRAWEVVRRAYEERPPRRRRQTPRLLVAGVIAVVAIVVGAALSPPGRAVFRSVQRAVGIEPAEPALFSLPAPGKLLVVSADRGGVWLVRSNGFLRKLGPYADAEWSPHGLYVVATEPDALVALDPWSGVQVRWRLTRRDPTLPRWEGTRTDTRIAYFTTSGLRVVAGDGTDDHLLDGRARRIAPAWDPGRLHTLAYSSGNAIVLRTADGKLVWRATVPVTPSALAWSTDGRYLAITSASRIVVLDSRGRIHRTVSLLGSRFRQAAFRPDSHDLAVVLRTPLQSEVRLVEVDRPGHSRLLFGGPGTFGDVAWSPVGGWLLVNWPAANQWVFLDGKRVHAVANIRQQFSGAGRRSQLELTGRWCCTY